jgi:hypothetical protein
MELSTDPGYQNLLGRISQTYNEGRLRAYQSINAHMTETYWKLGHDIVEYEQGGKAKADYGKALLTSLSRDLTLRHGKGFSRSNLIRFRQFYLTFPNGATLSHQLSWSHVVELLEIDDPLECSFYQQQEGWGARVIDRLSHDLKTIFPDMTGFSPRNFKYMRKFVASWPDRTIGQRTVAQLPLRSNLTLLDKLSVGPSHSG